MTREELEAEDERRRDPYRLRLNEFSLTDGNGMKFLRVPGGWVYMLGSASTFVPEGAVLQPMRTAPTDGTHLLGYGRHENDVGHQNVGFCEVSFNKYSNMWHSLCGLPSELDGWRPLPSGTLCHEN